jgi:hypothetical protein
MEELLQRYLGGYEKIRKALEGVEEELLRFKPAPNAWSIHEIVVHLCDADLVAAHRMKAVISETNPLLTAFDQDSWTSRMHYSELDLKTHLELFRLLRISMASVLQKLAPEEWQRTGIHNVAGKITLQDIVESYVEHVEGHLRQMERNKAAYLSARP